MASSRRRAGADDGDDGEKKEEKPLLLFSTMAGEGHAMPSLAIAAHLVRHGYQVAYVGSPQFRDKAEAAGIEYLRGPTLDEQGFRPADMAAAAALADPVERIAAVLARLACDTLQARVDSLEAALVLLRARHPARQIIVLEDVLNAATIPFRHGRPLPAGFFEDDGRCDDGGGDDNDNTGSGGKLLLPIRTIGLSPYPLMLQSRSAGPFLSALPFDDSPSGRARNRLLHRLANRSALRPLQEGWARAFARAGCPRSPVEVGAGDPYGLLYSSYDHVFQLCTPSAEYPLSDLPPNVEAIGCPRPTRSSTTTAAAATSTTHNDDHDDHDPSLPDWWDELVVRRPPGRKLVFVTQGTVSQDYTQLLLPTLRAFAADDDEEGGRGEEEKESVLVVGALGRRGAALDPAAAASLPRNARVADYLPYGAALARADALVSNAGYGSLNHAVAAGVPVVFAGRTEEKPEVCMRAERAGLGVNLLAGGGGDEEEEEEEEEEHRPPPSEEQIRLAVRRVLGSDGGKFRERALELRRENEEADCEGQVLRKVVELTV